MHFADQLLTAIAGGSFIVLYIVGLVVGLRLDKATLWPAALVTLLFFIVRAESAPLGFWAIAATSIVHLGTGCLTTLILRYTRPVGAADTTSKESQP